MTLDELIRDAKEDLRDWALDNPHMVESGNDDGQIHEIADSFVPVYTHDLLSLFIDDTSLAYETPESYWYGTAGNNVAGMAQVIVYDKLAEALNEEWFELGEAYRKYDDYRAECEDAGTEPLTFREWYEEGNY